VGRHVGVHVHGAGVASEHLAGVSLFALFRSVSRTTIVLVGLFFFIKISFSGANLLGVLVILVISSVAFLGLGLIAATLPVFSPERGAEAANILQGVLLLVSGIYYPVSTLPRWIRPFSALSPATYALSAIRKLMGIDSYVPGRVLDGAPLSAVIPEIVHLLVAGLLLLLLGLWIFGRVEHWAKRTGKLNRTG
jgi:ABC-2 type transport system permease protein